MRNSGHKTPVGVIVSEEKAFDHPFFPVVSRVVRNPDGTEREPQLLWDRQGKHFAIAVVTDIDGHLVLVEEPKYGQMKRMVSAPTGGIKKNEEPLLAARREFLDETGYQAEEWRSGLPCAIVDFADKSDGGEHFIFFAKNARKVGEPKGPGQKVILATHGEVMGLIYQGRVPAISMAAILLLFH